MNMAIPNIRHLHVFREVVHRGSVSAAARTANLSQPAVSQAVSSLEDAFDSTLFQRTPAGMQVTAAGRVLARRVTRALSQLVEGCGEM
jgi:DNA-binding transcriptional LysR family regulator